MGLQVWFNMSNNCLVNMYEAQEKLASEPHSEGKIGQLSVNIKISCVLWVFNSSHQVKKFR